MKSFFLQLLASVVWISIHSAVAQTNSWNRVESRDQMLEIRGPAIAVVSRNYLKDVSFIQAEITRMNVLRDKAIFLYEIDVTKFDRADLESIFETEQHLSLPEILVYNNGEWTPIKLLGEMDAFFRKNPLKDAPRFHRQIAESAFEHIRQETN